MGSIAQFGYNKNLLFRGILILLREIAWWVFGLLLGLLIGNKLIPRSKRVKLPKGDNFFFPEKQYITEISIIKIGDGKPTYWDNGRSIKDPEIVPEGIPYFTIGVFDGRGLGGGKHHKIWSEKKNIERLKTRLEKRLHKWKSHEII